MLSIAILMVGLQPAIAGEGDKVKVVSNDTTSSQVLFNVSALDASRLLVEVMGVSVDLASVSLMDRKGETKFFTFLASSSENIEISLDDVEPGIYYVKLNMDSEIRMKLVVVENQ